jgi:phosphoribosylamine--glycine ligase
MNVLILDTDSVGLDFALRAAAAGHAVKLFRYMKKPDRYGEGFKQIELVDDWRGWMPWAKDGLIFCTSNKRYLQELDRYRADFGYKVFGPTVQSARLEINRSAGMAAFKAIGVDMPAYQTFNSLEDAEAFARKTDRAWVVKPAGDNDDKSLTYVSRDPADLVGWLRRQIRSGKPITGEVMLQEKVDLLGEVGVSGWMGPEGFLPDKFQVCVEHKNLMDGEVGPGTGEQGSVMQYMFKDKLAETMLLPMEPVLRTLGHTGDFAIGAIVDRKGKAWPLEFTARCGYPAWWVQVASHRGDPVKWMRDLLDGKDSLRVNYDVGIGVVMAQPFYPYELAQPAQVEGVPIHGFADVLNDVHPVEVMMGKGPVMEGGKLVERPTYETTGEYVLVATGMGKTVGKARKAVYDTVDKIRFPNRMFRTDIGKKVIEALPALHEAGYLLDMKA